MKISVVMWSQPDNFLNTYVKGEMWNMIHMWNVKYDSALFQGLNAEVIPSTFDENLEKSAFSCPGGDSMFKKW